MRSKLLTSSFFAFLFLGYACSKSKSVQSNPIVGLWIGTFTSTQAPAAGNLYYSFDIRKDSTTLTQGVSIDGNTYYTSGKWTMTGNLFTATVKGLNLSGTGVVQIWSGTYNSASGTLVGTWQDQLLPSENGTFSLTRVSK